MGPDPHGQALSGGGRVHVNVWPGAGKGLGPDRMGLWPPREAEMSQCGALAGPKRFLLAGPHSCALACPCSPLSVALRPCRCRCPLSTMARTRTLWARCPARWHACRPTARCASCVRWQRASPSSCLHPFRWVRPAWAQCRAPPSPPTLGLMRMLMCREEPGSGWLGVRMAAGPCRQHWLRQHMRSEVCCQPGAWRGQSVTRWGQPGRDGASGGGWI
jgi:hypothetical protein